MIKRSTYQPAQSGVALWCLALSAGALLASASPASAASSNSSVSPSTIQTLEQQIQALQQQLNDLKAGQASAQQQIQAQQQTIAATAATAAAAQTKAEASGTKLVPNKLALSNADGSFTIGLTGRLNFDIGGYPTYSPQAGEATKTLSDGINARRARIGVAGTAFGDFSYALIYDAGGAPDGSGTIENAYIAFNGFKNTALEVGYVDSLFTLDEAVSSNDIMFMERSVATNIAESFGTGDNRSVLGGRTWGDNWWAGVYATGPTSNSVHSGGQEQIGVFGRATYQVVQEDNASLHIGAGTDQMLAPAHGANAFGSLGLSDRPDLRIDSTALISLGTVGTAANPLNNGAVYDGEIAGGYDSLYFQGEYFHYVLHRDGLQGNAFDGGYGQVGYTLTGESREYVPATGSYSAIKPAHPFSLDGTGWGAFEIGARVDYIDMNDDFTPGLKTQDANFLNGGKAIDFTAGLNWYVNNNMRFMFDYVHSHYMKTLTGTAAESAGYTSDGLAVRAQVNW